MTHPVNELPLAKETHQHSCGCHEAEGPSYPVLDARKIPHAIRHAAIFGAVDSLPSGAGIILAAPHDPLPLLAQARDRYGDSLSVTYLQRGPDAWLLEFVRQ